MTVINVTVNEYNCNARALEVLYQHTVEARKRLKRMEHEKGMFSSEACTARAKWSALAKVCHELGIETQQ